MNNREVIKIIEDISDILLELNDQFDTSLIGEYSRSGMHDRFKEFDLELNYNNILDYFQSIPPNINRPTIKFEIKTKNSTNNFWIQPFYKIDGIISNRIIEERRHKVFQSTIEFMKKYNSIFNRIRSLLGGEYEIAYILPILKIGAVDSVKVISDSVLVQYLGATPDTIATFQRYTIISPQHGQMLRYDSLTKSWKNYDYTSASSTADSIRVFSGSFPATGNIGLNSLINRIQYRVIDGDTTIYTLAVQDSTINQLALTDITFPTNDGTLVNTDGNYTTSSTNNAYGHTGLSSDNLTGDGWVQFEWQTGDKNAVFGFNTANSQTGFAGMEAAIFMDSNGDIYYVDNGTNYNALTAASSNDLLRINRVGSTLKLQKSSNSGSSWTDIHTYAFSSSATLYIVCDLYGQAATFLRQPKAKL
jgi:hypothetical protein